MMQENIESVKYSSQAEALTILLKIFVCLFTIIVVHYQTKAQQKYEYVSSICTEEINYYDQNKYIIH